MVDIVVTPANVVPGDNSRQETGISGETITAGMTVYLKPSDSKWYKADASDATKDKAYYAVTGSALDQPITVHIKGDLAFGAVLTIGTPYVLSDTLGGFAPVGDLASTDQVTTMGIATTTSNMAVQPHRSGAAVP